MIKRLKSKYADDPHRNPVVADRFVQWDPSVGNGSNLTGGLGVLPDPTPSDNPDHPSTNLHERVTYVDGYGTLIYGAKFSVWVSTGSFGAGEYQDQVVPIWQISAGDWLQLGTGAIWSDFDVCTLLVDAEY